TATCVNFLLEQLANGAQGLQVFDSWAGELPPHLFRRVALPSRQRVAEGGGNARAGDKGLLPPVVGCARGARDGVEVLAAPGRYYDIISLDWGYDAASARAHFGDAVALQGNLDPCALFASEEVIRAETRRMLDGLGARRTVANLGHGMLPEHDPNA